MMSTSAKDRATGSLIGLAVGDAVGSTLEFTRRDSTPPLTDMIGGGPFSLAPGEWTDDTSMALCLADALAINGSLDENDLMKRFVRWMDAGENSHNGKCFDIGITTREALNHFKRTGYPRSGDPDPHKAGNGSLMRLAPAAIRHHRSRNTAIDTAIRQGLTTHGAQSTVNACAYFCGLLVDAIAGLPKESILAPRPFDGVWEIAQIASGSFIAAARNQISSSGYVAHTLEAALWCVSRSDDFRSAILLAANLGDDSDTVGAVTGQLAGAIWGASGIPSEWLKKLAWYDRIRDLAIQLYELGERAA